MICPSCTTSIYFDPIKEMVFEISEGYGRTFEASYCPECNELIVISYTGEYKIDLMTIIYGLSCTPHTEP
ncbi:hypothetical protein D3C74_113860 [compost metagenome]